MFRYASGMHLVCIILAGGLWQVTSSTEKVRLGIHQLNNYVNSIWRRVGQVGAANRTRETEFHNLHIAFLRNCDCHNLMSQMEWCSDIDQLQHPPGISLGKFSKNLKTTNNAKTVGNPTFTVTLKPTARFRANHWPETLHTLQKKIVLNVARTPPYRQKHVKTHTDPSQYSASVQRDVRKFNR